MARIEGERFKSKLISTSLDIPTCGVTGKRSGGADTTKQRAAPPQRSPMANPPKHF